MRSPLGKYGQLVAAISAVSIIVAYLVALLIGGIFAIPHDNVAALERLALIATGAVFATAATLNGVKEPITSAHDRIDKLELGTGIPTHGTYPPTETPAPQ